MRVDIGLVAAVLESYPLNVTNHCDLTRGGSARQAVRQDTFFKLTASIYVQSEPNNMPIKPINNVEPVTLGLNDLTQVVQHYIKVALHYRLSNYVTVVYIIYACTYTCVGSLRWWWWCDGIQTAR